MKMHRITAAAPAPRVPTGEPAPVAVPSRWRRFWFTPIDPIGLHAFRILAGLLFLAWLLPFAGQLDSLFGYSGWFDRQAYAEAGRVVEDAPQQLSWSLLFVAGTSPVLLRVVYWLAIAVFVALSLGFVPRLTALLSWIAVVSFSANPALEYEGDVFLTVLAFYLMLGCLIDEGKRPGQSWLSWLLAPGWPLSRLTRSRDAAVAPSLGVNLAVRLLQVHFAIIMVTTGLHKLQFGDWWAGVALWYPLTPPMETTLAGARALASDPENFFFGLSVAAYAILAWQLAFPLFAWRRGLVCRGLLLGGALAGCLGAAFLYRLPVIGPALLVGCLAYLTPEEWRGFVARLDRCRQFVRNLASRPAAVESSRSPAGRVKVGVGQPG
jgi:hypothetical protein